MTFTNVISAVVDRVITVGVEADAKCGSLGP